MRVSGQQFQDHGITRSRGVQFSYVELHDAASGREQVVGLCPPPSTRTIITSATQTIKLPSYLHAPAQQLQNLLSQIHDVLPCLHLFPAREEIAVAQLV